MTTTTKNRVLWIVGAVTALCSGYLLCRFPFFGLHGMKEWPFDLLVLGLLTVAIAAILDSRKVMICTPAGYLGGFALGMLFGVNGVDPGGGRTNNAWVIWTVSFLITILAGMIWEYFSRRKSIVRHP